MLRFGTYAVILSGLAAVLPASAAQENAAKPPLRVVSVTGVVLADGADPQAVVAGESLDPAAVLKLSSGAQLRVATPCGTLVDIDGPRDGALGTLLETRVPTGPGCGAGNDARKKLILSFLEQSPERVFRGGARHGPTDALDIDLDAGSPACFEPGRPLVLRGDTQRLGDTLDIENPDTGDRGLAYFDSALNGWRWPEDIPVAEGDYVIATRLSQVRIAMKPLSPDVPDHDLALALAGAGCLPQARLLLRTLPADTEVPPQR